jgi:hypothetical protein
MCKLFLTLWFSGFASLETPEPGSGPVNSKATLALALNIPNQLFFFSPSFCNTGV